MKTYILNDSESKTLLEMASDCIERGMIAGNYEIDKIDEIINDSINMYGEFKQGIEVEMEVKVKGK